MAQKFLKIWGLLILLLVTTNLQAQPDPVEFLENLTDKIINTLKANKERLDKNPDHIYVIVDEILVPQMDFEEMSRWVIGRIGWMRATPVERTDFTKAFKNLVVRTYSGALNNYSNQTVQYLPLRSDYHNKDRVEVNSKIIEPGKEPLNVSYRLVQHGSQWRVYDIIIEGVSLLKGFHAQFSEKAKNVGLSAVTTDIKQHNTKEITYKGKQ